MNIKKVDEYLSEAVNEGNVSMVEHLLNLGGNAFATRKGRTYFEIAKDLENSAEMLEVLQKGAVKQFENLIKGREGNEIVKLMNSYLDKESCYNEINSQELGVKLLEAISKDDKALALRLINEGADVNYREDGGDTPLTLSSAKGFELIVKRLLEKGAYVDIKTGSWVKNTALTKAAFFGHSEVVEILLKNGANPNYIDGEKETALSKACIRGSVDCVRALLDNDADINMKTGSMGDTPLIVASRFGSSLCVRELLDRGADINIVNNYNDNAIRVAKNHSNYQVIDMLVEHKKNEDKKNGNNVKSKGFWDFMTGRC